MINDFIEGFKAAARSAGRLGIVQPYEEGRETALRKYASGLTMPENLDLAGLGLLAVPVAHSLVTNPEDESPGIRRAKNVTELAGLAALAASTLVKGKVHG